VPVPEVASQHRLGQASPATPFSTRRDTGAVAGDFKQGDVGSQSAHSLNSLKRPPNENRGQPGSPRPPLSPAWLTFEAPVCLAGASLSRRPAFDAETTEPNQQRGRRPPSFRRVCPFLWAAHKRISRRRFVQTHHKLKYSSQMFGSSARPVKARTPKQSLQEFLASLKPQPRSAAFGHQPTEAMMGRARERILKRRRLNDRSSTNALADPITIKIDILREVSSPDFQKEWLASELALAQDNLVKLKNKVATILAYHAQERSKDKLMPKSPSANVRKRSRQLYCAELTDNYTWQPVDVSVLNEMLGK
jgi:hypothetical protein